MLESGQLPRALLRHVDVPGEHVPEHHCLYYYIWLDRQIVRQKDRQREREKERERERDWKGERERGIENGAIASGLIVGELFCCLPMRQLTVGVEK